MHVTKGFGAFFLVCALCSLTVAPSCVGVCADETFVTFTAPLPPSSNAYVRWRRCERALPSRRLRLLIGLIGAASASALEAELYYVSQPQSARYGDFNSAEQLKRFIGVTDETVDAVTAWIDSALNASGRAYSFRRLLVGDWLELVTDVAAANILLRADYRVYRDDSGAVICRTNAYSLPHALTAHIDVIQPTTHTNNGRRIAQSQSPTPLVAAGNTTCGALVTPDCVRAMYAVDTAPVSEAAVSTSTVAAMGYLNEYFSPNDLRQFVCEYAVAAADNTPSVIGYNNANSPGVEAALDLQYIIGTAQLAATTFWSVGGSQPNATAPDNEPYLDWLAQLSDMAAPPAVISTSYSDAEWSVDPSYAARSNYELMKAGIRGITLVFASGDSGVGRSPCPNGNFEAEFPASSPYVTAVGATTMPPETGAVFSTGGFSTLFPMPQYQFDAVDAYLNNGNTTLPAQERYNKSNRAVPDVSAAGISFAVIVNGYTMAVSGTSASTPVIAAIFAVVNAARRENGQANVGFVNPLLYALQPTVFNDIVAGYNVGCNGAMGFQCASGWDPVTGLGTINATAMIQAITPTQRTRGADSAMRSGVCTNDGVVAAAALVWMFMCVVTIALNLTFDIKTQ